MRLSDNNENENRERGRKIRKRQRTRERARKKEIQIGLEGEEEETTERMDVKSKVEDAIMIEKLIKSSLSDQRRCTLIEERKRMESHRERGILRNKKGVQKKKER